MNTLFNSGRIVLLTAILLVSSLSGQLAAQPKLLGKIDMPNSGAEEAQADFMEGMLFLHNFEYYDAAEAFRRAQEKDPDFGMAYWGEAKTHNHPVWMEQEEEAAQQALAKLGETAEERAAFFPTEREKDYQTTLEILYGNTPESAGKSKEERDDLYREAMRKLHEKYPDDDEATTFYALSILGSAHEGRDFATYMKAAAVAFTVWDHNKQHPGAAHYLIHSFDDPIHAPLGLPMARAYSKIAPSAAHAQHMTSHIFVALGMWDETVHANEIARDVQDARRDELGRPPNVCGHYTYWLEYGYIQQNRLDDARKVLDNCAARVADDPSDGERGYFGAMRARYIIDTGSWELADDYATEYDAGKWGGRDYHFANALAAAKLGDEETAREEVELMWLKAWEEDDEPPILDKQISGLLALNRGEIDAGLRLLREAATLEAELPFEFGPPEPVMPAHELLGRALLDLGRYDEARAAFEAQLKRTPNRTTTLEALSEVNSATSSVME
jgi:tetratricopeptide (TPR) repeat protein